MAERNLKGDVNVEFTEATSRQGIDSGESVKTLFGKIRKWLSDLKAVAFSGSYKDLIEKPTLGSAASKNVPSTGNASTSEVVMGNDSRLSDSRPASDVSAWAKATTKPTYTASEVGAATASHTHSYLPLIGGTVTGNITMSDSKIILKGTNIDLNGSNPSSLTWSNSGFDFYDKDDNRAGFINVARRTNGSTQLSIMAECRNSDDSGNDYNGIEFIIDRSGNRTYAVSNAANFRKAIATGNQVTLTGAVTGAATFSDGNVASVSTVWKSGVVGSNVPDLNEKYWFKVASTTNKSTNFDINSVFLIEDTYYYSKRNAIIKIDTRNSTTIDADGLVYLKFIANNGFSINDIVVVSKYEDSTRKYELWVKNTAVWNAIRTTVLSEGHRGGTLANYWTIYNNFANSNVGETSYPTDGWKAYFPEDDISGELDCLLIQAALVNNEVRIENTSDFTNELYHKYFSYTKPKFAILKLQITSSTYYYKALLNSSSVSQATVMEASFITVNGTYMSIYKFSWSLSGTVGTPTVSHTSLNLGS